MKAANLATALVGSILATSAIWVMGHPYTEIRPASAATTYAAIASVDRPHAIDRPATKTCPEAVAAGTRALRLWFDKHDRAAYNEAVSGLYLTADCNDETRDLGKGVLLSAKGLAEHNLPEGSSTVDLNQAVALLARCQLRNYGEELGAECKTMEDIDIQKQVNWQMGR
jgi:hypothetical protein